MATNCNRTLSCISLLEYFLLVSPPLNKVPIPNINTFEIFYDSDVKLAKKFSLRGIPTSILINKDGYEFAKVIGSINFEHPKFVNWLLNYD